MTIATRRPASADRGFIPWPLLFLLLLHPREHVLECLITFIDKRFDSHDPASVYVLGRWRVSRFVVPYFRTLFAEAWRSSRDGQKTWGELPLERMNGYAIMVA